MSQQTLARFPTRKPVCRLPGTRKSGIGRPGFTSGE
jgi:hypothetical protein